ncbi:MAG TPA: VOC family protein [Acidimicrobiales bacterium]|nr:VOC family protein [Acidimicrobiales bacterium]
MPPELNHIILPSNDMHASAAFTSKILGLEQQPQWGPFMPVVLGNGVTIDYLNAEVLDSHHCAFIVDDAEFEPIFERITTMGIPYYADPGLQHAGEINHYDRGSGVYFLDPDGHLLEVITRPYGSGSTEA